MATISHALIQALFTGFRADFQDGLTHAPSQYQEIATIVPSTTASNTYGWLGNMPNLREWIGARAIENISNMGYQIINKKWETSIGIERVNIEDDNIGIYKPAVTELGRQAGVFPDQRIFELLAKGDTIPCYDEQNFFDHEHPVFDRHDGTGTFTPISNLTDGSEPAWYLLDCSRAIKPLIYQERTKPELITMTDTTDERVFMYDEYRFGVRVRANVGFGFWQMAHMSKMVLNGDNLWNVISKMRQVTGDGDKRLAIRPTHLVVPPALEKQATRMLERELDSSSSNELKGRLKLIVGDYL